MTTTDSSDAPRADDTQRPGWRTRFRDWWNNAFHIEPYDETSLSETEKDVLRRLADSIHRKRMTPAAILWAHSHRHMNFIGSSAMLLAKPYFEMTHPFINVVLKKFGAEIPPDDYPVLMLALEKRFSIEYFVQRLEANADEDYNNRPASDASHEATGADAAKPDTDGING